MDTAFESPIPQSRAYAQQGCDVEEFNQRSGRCNSGLEAWEREHSKDKDQVERDERQIDIAHH
jgi:hypothetical protein